MKASLQQDLKNNSLFQLEIKSAEEQKNVAVFINYRTPNPKPKFSHPSTFVFCSYGPQWSYIITIYA